MLWIEPQRGRYRWGEAVKVGVFARGFTDLPWEGERQFRIWAVNPSGVLRELQVAPDGSEEYAAVHFLPGETGVYTVGAAISGDVNFSTRTYFSVERERNLLLPPAGEGLVIAPVWYEGSYLGWPVCLEARFDGDRLMKTEVTVFPGLWQGERLYRVTDMAGQMVLDGRNWCYWAKGGGRKEGMVFSPWGANWLVLVDHIVPGGRRYVATCILCPE